jgi:hypothetical protein
MERGLLTPVLASPTDEFDGIDAFLLAFGGKEVYMFLSCASTEFTCCTRVSLERLIWESEDRRDSSASFHVIVCKVVFNYGLSGRKEGLIGPERHRKSIIYGPRTSS